jgi:hypothetical protein
MAASLPGGNLASRGASGPAANSGSWYRLANSTAIPPPSDYRQEQNIRKVATLGSMWRGVPLCNYANEVRSPVNMDGFSLGQADFTFTTLGSFTRDLAFDFRYLGIGLQNFRLNGPSIEVLAVNSPWMNYLVYGDPQVGADRDASPFDDNVAYGSVAGDDNNYLFAIDPYKVTDQFQRPSWFPYLRLETATGTDRNNHDGIVPVWSASIPGSYFIAPTDHSGLPDHAEVGDHILRSLNSAALPIGKTLNSKWNQTTALTSEGGRTWTFRDGEMAPTPQDVLYRQIDGVGRIHPSAIKEIRTARVTNKTQTSVTLAWDTVLPTTSQVILLPVDFPLIAPVVVSDSTLTVTHRMTVTGLLPDTAYYYTVSSHLPRSPEADIVLANVGLNGESQAPILFTLPETRPVLSINARRGSLSVGANTLGFAVDIKNTGGVNASNFEITRVEFQGAGATFAFTTPSRAEAPRGATEVSVTANRTDSRTISSLSVRLSYRYE